MQSFFFSYPYFNHIKQSDSCPVGAGHILLIFPIIHPFICSAYTIPMFQRLDSDECRIQKRMRGKRLESEDFSPEGLNI